jgi:hypothetical protein
LQDAWIFAFLPFSIRFLSHIAKFARDHVSPLEESSGVGFAGRAVRGEALSFGVLLVFDEQPCIVLIRCKRLKT